MRAFLANRPLIPEPELRRYAGQHVAFRWDGTAIVAGAPDPETLDRQLVQAGIDLEAVTFGYIEGADDDFYLGALELE